MSCANLTISSRRRPGPIILMARTTSSFMLTMSFVLSRALLASIIVTRERGPALEYAAEGQVLRTRILHDHATGWVGPQSPSALIRRSRERLITVKLWEPR
jgi:hypothetical protein